MPARRKMPEDSLLRAWFEEGLTRDEVIALIKDRTGETVGPTAVSTAMRRLGFPARQGRRRKVLRRGCGLTDADIARFWSKVMLPTDGGCMLWTAGLTPDGYGKFRAVGRMMLASRVSLELATGASIGDASLALHSCRNRDCVAPAHLRWGTYLENKADELRDGTRASILTAADVLAIRASAGTETQRSLADRFGVDGSTISNIIREKNWIHLSASEAS